MKIDTVSFLLGMPQPFWAPDDEGASGGGSTDGDAGNDVDAGESQTDDTVLGDETPGDTPEDDDAQGDGAGKDDEKDDEAGDSKDDDANDDEGADEVPEDGVYEFELPEGVDVPDDKKELWSNQFKELGLTRAQAKALVEMQSKEVLAEQAEMAKLVEEQQKAHLDAAKADKDIGGDNWDESARLAKLGLKAMGGTAIKDLILSTGNGNNPEMIRELRRIGEMQKDDTFEAGSSHETPVATEAKWYGNTTPDTKKG